MAECGRDVTKEGHGKGKMGMPDKKKILVVDDDKDLVRSIKAFLEVRGYEVQMAFNGTEAQKSIDGALPDLIILDVMMDHDTEGLNLAYKLQNETLTRRMPIILLSGFMDHVGSNYQKFEFVQGRDWPAARFFEKPVQLSALADSVGKLITEAEQLKSMVAPA
jgi:DNA-binding response OmpR family regulator